MKKYLLALALGLLPAAPAHAITRTPGINVAISTFVITQNNATPNPYPNAPLVMTGNINSYLQSVIQNLSNGAAASAEYTGSNDLGSNTSFFFTIGINSSKYSQALYSLEPASATFFESGDSPIYIWADTNSGLNGATSGYVLIGAGNQVQANIGLMVTPSSTTVQNMLYASSAAVVGVYVSSSAVGGAGSAVTANCISGRYAVGGGCNCTGGVGITSVINQPNSLVIGSVPTGWTCQDAGGTGATCAAYAVCSRLQ